MSSLNDLINSQSSAELREELLDRLAIVEHKIKFLERVPLCFLDSEGNSIQTYGALAELAGALLTSIPQEAVFVIFAEPEKGLDDLMRNVPTLLDEAWQAVKFDRVCLLADDYDFSKVEESVAFVEAVAEMTHPGMFIFGDEGQKWIRFKVSN